MASKTKVVYVCSECGYQAPKWCGKCPECECWNTMEEQLQTPSSRTGKADSFGANFSIKGEGAVSIGAINTSDEFRYRTGLNELDRVLGGGIVKGAVMLVSGDPGIGKSTIMLQICQQLSSLKILYISGEESQRQIKLRATRLGVNSENLFILCDTDLESIVGYIHATKPDLVIVDSIQTMNLQPLNSSPGSVTQIRECTNAFLRTAKTLEIPFFIVGHVNKDGAIAGPKVLEHIVDAVLYFEGERNMSYRILRAVKNRFGSTNEIGVFEMGDKGLYEVENPSLMMLSGRPTNVAGTCVACVMEGSRPILAEVQALVTTTPFGNPRRMCTGFDYNRMNLILAVLEKRGGYFFSNLDVYINVIGGLRLDEPAADLTVAMALVSGLKDKPIPENLIAFGEIGLAGEIRSVNSAKARVQEAARLGFKWCILPYNNFKSLGEPIDGIEVIGVRTVRQAFEAIANIS
jgi:DNA repair protein RadA/Sms